MDSMEKVLNHLGNTAVYIIRADNHQILYCNDRVKAVTPSARTGMVCHEVWKGECRNCPLLSIGEKETNTTVNYGDSFGEIVDISATRMFWGEGQLPAFLISVTPHTRTEEEAQMAKVLLSLEREHRILSAGLSVMFGEFLVVDLDTGSFITYKADAAASGIQENEDFAKFNREYGERLIHPEDQERFFEMFRVDCMRRHVAEGQNEFSVEMRRRNSEGNYRWCELIGTVMEKEESGGKQVLLTFRDIHTLREALNQALEMANQASAAKTDFLSRMSHDIRTPLNVILGMTVIAEHELGHPDKVGNYLGKIEVSAKFLLSLVNDVLDMSKIESGKMVLVEEPVQLRELLGEVAIICRSQARQRRQEFVFEIKDPVADYYLGDALHLKRLLMNLLGNAMKYTQESGRVSLEVQKVGWKKGKDILRITISDNGIGMSEEFQKKLFEPFEQEQKGGGRVFEGSGLGLAISQNLVRLMGGTIEVESRVGEGTTFRLDIPFAKARKWDLPPKEEKEEDWQFSDQPILLVEDNLLNLEIAKAMLEMQGLTVETAENGKEAVEKFAQSKQGYYQAILMDLRMPVMNGYEAAAAIRKLGHPDAASVPIIAVTADAFKEDIEKVKRVGMNAHVSKPIEKEQLYRVLSRVRR